MSYVFNMVGGGSGGGGGPSASDAILTVTVPTGSTVTATKGGVTLTPTMWVQAADATMDCALFVIQPSLFDAQNAWTVTSTLSGDTASGTVTIDSNEQYDMILSYRIPPDYQEVEYLAASGTQYINTGVHPEANYARVIAECLISSNSTSAFGAQAGSNEFALYILAAGEGNIYCGTSHVGLGSYFSKSTMHKYDIIANSGNCVTNIDGHIVNLSYGGSIPSTESLFLFAENSNGTVTTKSTSRFHRFAMLDELGNYLCDLYSVYRKSDSVAGMYDLVSKTFKTNDGSGIFTVGPDVT